MTTLAAAVALTLTGCTAGGSAGSASPASSAPGGSKTPPSAVAGPERLTVTTANWSLPTALSRTVALTDGTALFVAGGLTASNTSTAAISRIDPASGAVTAAGTLAQAVHDAGGTTLGGRFWVMGGGDKTSTDAVQSFSAGAAATAAGTLPHPRSDLAVASDGNTAYVVGGYDGTTDDLGILKTTDGRQFTPVGTLKLGVRYTAAVVADGALWVFGGEHAGAPSPVVQRLDLTTGAVDDSVRLPAPLAHETPIVLHGRIFLAGGRGPGGGRVATVTEFDPKARTFSHAGDLAAALSDAAGVTIGDTGYLLGGETPTALAQVTLFRLVAPAASPSPSGSGGATDAAWLDPASGPGTLAPGSDPSVLPAPILIADKRNNRVVIVDPQGRVRWQFPRPGDLAPGQQFRIPDDAFFSPDGKQIIATEEDYFAISVIDIASHRIVYRYGTPGVRGSGPNQLNNPDDALLLSDGSILSADIKNCRIIVIPPGGTAPSQQYGTTGVCAHHPPARFDAPNGAFPMRNGHYLVTEINGSWVDELARDGSVSWSVQVPGVTYPSDSNEISPGHYLTVGYTNPGQALIFDRAGNALWRYRPSGAQALNHPSLGLPLPNGKVLITDDYNHRVIVVDPATSTVVWQYGVTGSKGAGPGQLNNPDGLDLMPPYNLLAQH